jgi:hypothetical protein
MRKSCVNEHKAVMMGTKNLTKLSTTCSREKPGRNKPILSRQLRARLKAYDRRALVEIDAPQPDLSAVEREPVYQRYASSVDFE